jgi:hypothetical protein
LASVFDPRAQEGSAKGNSLADMCMHGNRAGQIAAAFRVGIAVVAIVVVEATI